jgi:integrase/recombinase XerD
MGRFTADTTLALMVALIVAFTKGIQLNMLQKWMGHADMKTTAIYANAMGAEEQSIAAKMWAN